MELETVEDEVAPATQESCPNCGSTDFLHEGGFFYCSSCFTQSQVSRIYLDDAFRPELQGLNRTKAQTLREKTQTKSVRAAYGPRTLSTWEVWNVVLKYMAEQLIEIGFPKVVKAKILELYVLYMRRRGVFFVSILNPYRPPRITVGEPKTNLYSVLGMKKTATLGKARKRMKLKKKAKKNQGEINPTQATKRSKTFRKRKALEQDYVSQLPGGPVVDENEFDNMIEKERREESQDNNNAINVNGKVRYTELARKLIRKNKAARNRAIGSLIRGKYKRQWKAIRRENFAVTKCLLTVFAALRELGFSVGIPDVIRLFNVGTLRPDNLKRMIHEIEWYREANVDKLSTSRVLQLATFHNLGPDTAAFVEFLGIKAFNYPRVKELIPKYIDDFVLPREFECFVTLLNDLFTFENYCDDMVTKFNLDKYRAIPEILILAQFLVVLKMLFGLDDVTEKYQSSFARLVNKIMSEEVGKNEWEMEDWNELFVIEDWFGYLQRRRTVVTRELCNSCMYTPNSPPSLAKLNDLMKHHSIEDDEDLEDEDKTFMQAANSCKDLLKEIFTASLINQGKSTEIPRLKPYLPLPLPTESVARQYVERYPAVANPSIKPALLAHDFVTKRIDFIWNPKKYTRMLQMKGYKVKIIHGDAVNNFPHDLAQEVKESKVFLVFIPYKHFDDFIGKCKENCSSSMKFLLDLCNDIIPGLCPLKESPRHPLSLVNLVNSIGDMFIKRVLTELIPVLTRYDEDDSE